MEYFKQLIKDERLHENLDRSRSGIVQVFKEKYNNKILFKLTPPSQEMYAELIEGKWYWLKCCNTCKDSKDYGKTWTYQVCDKHDVCVRCFTHRKDLQKVWGHEYGFICESCKTIVDNEIKCKALKKIEEKGYDAYDYMQTDEILCPHCGTEQDLPDIGSSVDNLICDTCGGKFDVEVETVTTFTTSVVGERLKC